MPADHYIMDSDMKKVADAIRAKGETTAPLTFPDGMVQAVNDIQAGGGTDIEDALIMGEMSKDYVNDRVTKIIPLIFKGSKLTSAEFPNVLSVGFSAFSECFSLITVNLPNAEIIDYDAFFNSYMLKNVHLPRAISIGNSAFYNCNNLITIDLPKVTSLAINVFLYCTRLTTVKLGWNQVVQAGTDLFKKSDLAQIYVPNNLVEQYKVATNWSQYASRIHPMSEAPQ